MSKPIHVKPMLYAFYFEALKVIALKYGYNLVLHGSVARDLDLIAIPWVEVIGDKMEMIKEMAEILGGDILPDSHRGKPHGREVVVININRTIITKFDGMGVPEFIKHEDPQYYIDISIMPTTN